MSNRIAPVQEPVTGRERIADPAQPRHGLVQFYRALNSRDLALMAQSREQSGEAAMDDPLAGSKRGWPEIRPVYERLLRLARPMFFEFRDYTEHGTADLYWGIGRERGHPGRGDERLDPAIRTTRLFRLAGTHGRQSHHHGSIEDPRVPASDLALIGDSGP